MDEIRLFKEKNEENKRQVDLIKKCLQEVKDLIDKKDVAAENIVNNNEDRDDLDYELAEKTRQLFNIASYNEIMFREALEDFVKNTKNHGKNKDTK